MTRVDFDSLVTKERVTISRADFMADWKRGFSVLEFRSAGEIVRPNPRNPGHQIRVPTPAVLVFRCMRCQFDVVDSSYPPSPKSEDKRWRTGLDLIQDHLAENQHPWPYNPFENPYGNVDDVIIEGVEDYAKEIGQL